MSLEVSDTGEEEMDERGCGGGGVCVVFGCGFDGRGCEFFFFFFLHMCPLCLCLDRRFKIEHERMVTI